MVAAPAVFVLWHDRGNCRPAGGARMNKRFRLRKNSEFRSVRGGGRSWVHPLLVLYARRNELEWPRVGISVGKRIGNAVTRNRVKRLIREAVRGRLPQIGSGWDLLFIGRTPIAQVDFAAVSAAVDQLLQRSGLLSGPPTHDRVSRRATTVAQNEAGPPLASEKEGAA
jgi:ribonuclease P protein component